MPQLMPMFWVSSVMIIMLIVLMLLNIYFYNYYMNLTMSKMLISSNYVNMMW